MNTGPLACPLACLLTPHTHSLANIASSAHALRSTHSFARSFTYLLLRSWEMEYFDVSKIPSFNPQCLTGLQCPYLIYFFFSKWLSSSHMCRLMGVSISLYHPNAMRQYGPELKKISQQKQTCNDSLFKGTCSKQNGVSKRVSGAGKPANGRASGPVLTSGFLIILHHSA